jgi:hypothetical protein
MKVKYIGADNEQVAWGGNDDPRELLIIGETYTVIGKEVHSWHTKIILEDYPDKKFNDSSFKYV